jgi:hypothetical protein
MSPSEVAPCVVMLRMLFIGMSVLALGSREANTAAAGNESPVSILSVERVDRACVPFVLTVPAVVGASPLRVGADGPDDVEARVIGGVVSRCEAGSFAQDVALTPGRTVISIEVAFGGELDLAVALHTVQVDFMS